MNEANDARSIVQKAMLIASIHSVEGHLCLWGNINALPRK